MPIDPFTMMAIAQGVPALLQAGTGVAQFISGNRMRKDLVRPEYEIPEAARAALGQARSLASSQEMAGMSQAENEMNQILSLGVQAAQQTAGSSSEALGAVTNMFANRMRQQNSLAGQAAQDYMRRQADVTQQLGNMATYQDKEWQLNEMQPFLDQAAMASAMGGAGMQNMMGGLQGLGGAIGGAYANKALLDAAKSGMGTMTPPATPNPFTSPTVTDPAEVPKTMTSTNNSGSTFTGATYLTDPYIVFGADAQKVKAALDYITKKR